MIERLVFSFVFHMAKYGTGSSLISIQNLLYFLIYERYKCIVSKVDQLLFLNKYVVLFFMVK